MIRCLCKQGDRCLLFWVGLGKTTQIDYTYCYTQDMCVSFLLCAMKNQQAVINLSFTFQGVNMWNTVLVKKLKNYDGDCVKII